MTKFINAKCDFCGKEYIANKKSYQNSERKGQKHYCSISCQMKSRMNGKIVTCKSCGKEFYVAKSSINNSGNNFCCVRCAHDFIDHSHRHSYDTRKKISKSLKIYNLLNKRDIVRRDIVRHEKTCPICGKIFFVEKCNIDKIYCSRECYNNDTNLKYRKKNGGGKRHGSGRGKKGWYKGYFCDSSWELAFVIYNLEHGIKFERNKQGFEYEFDGEKHKFYPDFILEDGTYVEIKGYFDDKNKEKIKCFNKNIIILSRNEIKQYIDYVEEKYGKNFIEKYDSNPYKIKKNICKICGKPCVNMYCSRKCSGIAVNKYVALV